MISALASPRPRTTDDRVAAIARTIRCPTCQGQSAAESDAPASLAIRGVIDQQLRAGGTATTIRDYLVDRYGPDILLQPRANGLTALVWILPAVVFTVGTALVVLALRRRPSVVASTDDHRLVDDARRKQHDRDFVPSDGNPTI